MDQNLPSDNLAKPTRRLPIVLGGLGVVALAVGAFFAGPALAANLNPTPTPSPTATEYHATLTPAEEDSVQQAADDQAAQIAAEKKAAADAAAAQAAADAAAAKATHHSSSAGGAPYCPAGTSMTQGDSNGAPEWCLPTSCFGADPGPDCTTPVAAIKP